MQKIRFRPHHFLCTVGFEGKGYSEEFVENYSKIAHGLRDTPNGDDTQIEVVTGTDSICAPCPNREGNLCATESKIKELDTAHASALGIRPGEVVSWGNAKEKIRNTMTAEKLRMICAPCSWLRSGMCERALEKLKMEKPTSRSARLLVVGIFATSLFLGNSSLAPAATLSELTLRQAALRTKLIGKVKATRTTKALAKAAELIDAEEFSAAASAAAGVEKDSEFADHALALRGLAHLAEAEQIENEEEKPDWAKIGTLSNRSVDAWTRIYQSHLSSPWWPNAPKEVGKGEIESALSEAMRKKTGPATKLFEKAFQRLALDNGLSLVKSRHLDAYADLCKKKKSEICIAWIVRFGNFNSKNSAESKTLQKKYPDIIEAAKPTFANSKVTTGYKQKDADEVAFDEAFPLVLEESYGPAVEAFKKFLEDYPRSSHRFRARYWLAVSLEKKKSTDEARPHYEQLVRETPLTLYGLLAMLTLKQDPEGRFKGNGPQFVEHDDLQTPLEAVRLGRVRKLLAANADRLAAMDLRSFRARDTASGPYLMWLASYASTAGAHIASFSILSDLIARMDDSVYTQDGLDLVFPIVQWPLVERLSAAAGVDPVLVLALIKQESAFDREAGSSVGATGFMQLMPFTASDVEADVERRDLLELETNVRIGTKYLKKVLDRYKGNVGLALAGYNAGPTAVDRWVREGRASRSFLEYVEQIPYKETRDYVGTIFRNYVWYQARIRGLKVTETSPFWPASAPAAEKPSISTQ